MLVMKQHLGNRPAPQLSISDTYIWDFPPPASHRSPAGPAASLAASRLSQPSAAAMAPDSSEGLGQRAAGGRLVRRQLLSAPTGGRGRLGQLGADLLRGISPWGGSDRGVWPALSCQAPGQKGGENVLAAPGRLTGLIISTGGTWAEGQIEVSLPGEVFFPQHGTLSCTTHKPPAAPGPERPLSQKSWLDLTPVTVGLVQPIGALFCVQQFCSQPLLRPPFLCLFVPLQIHRGTASSPGSCGEVTFIRWGCV